MTSIRNTLVLACAVSVLGLGAAFAQTDPAAPAGGAMTAPAGGAMAAPAGDAMQGQQAMPSTPKKKMAKKHMSKKMMKKKTM